MAGAGADACLTAQLQRAKPMDRCSVTGGGAVTAETEHVFALRCLWGFLAA